MTALPEGARVCARTGLVLVPAKGETGWRLAKTSYGPVNPPARPADPEADPAGWGRFDVRSGRTSDASDAYLLTWCTDGHRLRALSRGSDATRLLRTVSRSRKQLVEAQVALVNQPRAELERFPAAIGLFARLGSDVAIAFLRGYPTKQAAASLAEACFAGFLQRIAYCVRKPVT